MNSGNSEMTLFFIPDISGFTKFVTEVEMEHSAHIIAELLEIIIASNSLGLTVAEIEGDAVFFYRMGEEPTFYEITEQVRTMYLNFHQHLKYYERDRICQCGACSTANQLTLKIIHHFGKSTKRKIGHHVKLFGPDVILGHRFLKNTIAESEYVLFSKLPPFCDRHKEDWVELRHGSAHYNDIGQVQFDYLPLTPLRKKLADLPPRPKFKRYGRPVVHSLVLDTTLKNLHGTLTDFSLRPRWIYGLRSVIVPEQRLHRVGMEHLCIMPRGKMAFEVTSQFIKEGHIEYTEQSNSIGWLAPLTTIFILERLPNGKASLQMEVHYKRSRLTRFFLDLPLRAMLYAMMVLSLHRLKGLTERGHKEGLEAVPYPDVITD